MDTLRLGDTGTLVEFLQSALKKLGVYTGGIDGIFGRLTRDAVMAFQRGGGLAVDGIVGASTWNALHPYINGYERYAIRSGDTLFNIAALYSSSVARILAANPGIDVLNLRVGQRIIVPFGDVVPTDISYTPAVLELNLRALGVIYPFLKFGVIGTSELCEKIPCVRIGTGATEVFYNASFHANEWITTPVLMKFIESFARAYADDTNIYGHNARTIFENTSIYIVPMVNPDGVSLVTGALAPGTEAHDSARLISERYPFIPFPQGWKANINGIDLNLQFPANWERAREIKFEQGFTGPAPRDYVGPEPLIAAEALAVYRFTVEHDFRLIIAYHTQGQVIFWQYLDYMPENSYYIANRFAQSSGYGLEQTPYASSFAGYKDWFIQEYNRPGYTVEAGIGTNPLPIAQFDAIYSENEGILVLGAVLAAL